ncbi:homeotic protein spalt-major-like [Contarinia nasturtii]|uniref:homeotic protein spalt-major-like n=1 Tax=Contarinia nasturtii TaxID=265458 RepID=UPI0012D42EC2|nr:homeotic protein spalt-major-like [Contarinia nasturtii]
MSGNWQQAIDKYCFNIQYEAEATLRFVDNAFGCSGMSFDENFKEYFFQASNERIAKAYELFLNKAKLERKFIGVRDRNAPTNHNLDTNKTTTDASGEIMINGSYSCHRPELGTAQSTYKIAQGNGRGDESAICVTIIISNQPAIDPRTNQEANVLVNRMESDGTMNEAESMPTKTNGTDESEDKTVNDSSNKGTTNNSMTAVAREEINEVTDRLDVNNAMDEPQLLPSGATEIDHDEDNIGNGKISDKTTNGMIETKEASRATSEFDEIKEIDAPEVEAIHINIENDSIVDDLIHETAVASLENIGNQINRNYAQKRTTNQRRKRKIAEASTSNGNSKKKRKVATRSTLKTIPELISESPLVDLTFDEAERSQQSNNVNTQSSEQSETNSNGADQQNESTSRGKSKTKCEFCNYVSWPSHLIIHRRIHTGEKPFECNICAKRFTTKQSLNKHMRTHAKQFPFHCSICRQGFTAKRTKESHEKSCNPRRYECYICKYHNLYKTH